MKTLALSPFSLYSSMAFFVALACLGLGYLDHETRSIMDLFNPGNIFGLSLYFVPAFLLSVLFYKIFSKKHYPLKSLVYALLAGVPLAFTLVILLFVIFAGHKVFA